MSDLDKTTINVMWTVAAENVEEGDRIFDSHVKWMTGHARDGQAALLSYGISKGRELADPMDPNSAETGNTGLRAHRGLPVARWRPRALEAGHRHPAGPSGLPRLGREGQGHYAAQRHRRPGPLVAEGSSPPRGPPSSSASESAGCVCSSEGLDSTCGLHSVRSPTSFRWVSWQYGRGDCRAWRRRPQRGTGSRSAAPAVRRVLAEARGEELPYDRALKRLCVVVDGPAGADGNSLPTSDP